MTVALLVASILLVVTIAIDIVGTVTNEWLTYTYSGVDAKEGIWRFCPDSVCQSLSDTESLEAVRAMMLIGIILGGIALIVSIVEYGYSAFREKYNTGLVVAILALVIVADLCTMIGVVVYVAKYKEDRQDKVQVDVDKGFSFWLGVAAVFLYTIVAFILFFAVFQHAKQKKIAESRNEDRQKMFAIEKELERQQRWRGQRGGSPSRRDRNSRHAHSPRRSRSESRRQYKSGDLRYGSPVRRSGSDGYEYGYMNKSMYKYGGMPNYKFAGYAMAPPGSNNRAFIMTAPNRAYALTAGQPVAALPVGAGPRVIPDGEENYYSMVPPGPTGATPYEPNRMAAFNQPMYYGM